MCVVVGIEQEQANLFNTQTYFTTMYTRASWPLGTLYLIQTT